MLRLKFSASALSRLAVALMPAASFPPRPPVENLLPRRVGESLDVAGHGGVENHLATDRISRPQKVAVDRTSGQCCCRDRCCHTSQRSTLFYRLMRANVPLSETVLC